MNDRSTPADEAFARLLAAPAGEGLDDALDAAASRLAADPDGGRALTALADRVLRTALAAGWTGADLPHLARRRLDREPAELLDDLADPGDDLLAAAARRHRLDRFTAAGRLLALLRMVALLPRIAAPAARARPPRTRREPPVLGRIRGLLAKAESTAYPEEAEALSAKAQELMARHSLDEAALAAGGTGGPGPVHRRIWLDAPNEEPKALLLDAVARANHCRAVWDPSLGFATAVGFAADLDAVELLHASLLRQAETALNAGETGRRARARKGRDRTRHYRHAFLTAYAARVGERLEQSAARAAAEAADGTDLLPVLAGREAAVADTAEELFPQAGLTSTRIRIRDESGWTEGSAAADGAAVTANTPLPGAE